MRSRVLALAVALALLSGPRPLQAQTAPPASGWVRLGSTGIRTESSSLDAHVFAVAEDWPIGLLIVLEQATAPREKVSLRSLDGGTTWSAVTLPPGVTQVRLPPAPVAGQRVAFAAAASGLHRSTDDATTWQLVVPSTSTGQLLVSRTFAMDETALFLSGGEARLTADGGSTWTVLASPIDDTRFSSLQLSPDFAHDRALFAIVDGRAFVGRLDAESAATWQSINFGKDLPVEALFVSPGFAVDRTLLATVATTDPPAEEELDPEAVLDGIVVSRDGGTTWLPSQGLERDGLPYRWHAFVQLSPTFEDDQTAFAFAYAPWGHPGNPYQSLPLVRRALFRSDDGGLAWHSVFSREALAPTDGGERLVLSPDFAQDHFAVLWSVNRDIIGRGSTCRVSRTIDAGETWTVARQGGTSYLSGDLGCADMAVGGPPGNLAAVMATFLSRWEVLTMTPPASAGLPPADAPEQSAGLSRATTTSVATIPSSGPNSRGTTMFASRVDGSIWVLSTRPR